MQRYILHFARKFRGRDLYTYSVCTPYHVGSHYLKCTLVYILGMDPLETQEGKYRFQLDIEHFLHMVKDCKGQKQKVGLLKRKILITSQDPIEEIRKILRSGGLGKQLLKGSPVSPLGQLQIGVWFKTLHSALIPQDPGHGSVHFSLIQAKELGHSELMLHSGLQLGGVPM